MGGNDWVAAAGRALLRIALVAAALLAAVFVLVLLMALLAAWSVRAAWARLTGRPVGAWHMGFDPGGRFRQAYGAAGRWQAGGRARAAADGEAGAASSARDSSGPLPLRSRQGVTDVEARPVEPGPPRD